MLNEKMCSISYASLLRVAVRERVDIVLFYKGPSNYTWHLSDTWNQ